MAQKDPVFELCDKVRESSFALHKYLRHGLKEKIYENGLVNRLRKQGVPVLQQPSRANDFVAIVQVSDPRGGADNYRLEISWSVSTAEEPYQAGRVTWRGRVDHRAAVVDLLLGPDFVLWG